MLRPWEAARGCAMVESGNELHMNRFDVPRGHSNIKGIGERRLGLRRASGGLRRTKLRESRFKVCVQLVGRFLRVVPDPTVSKTTLARCPTHSTAAEGRAEHLTGSETSLRGRVKGPFRLCEEWRIGDGGLLAVRSVKAERRKRTVKPQAAVRQH